MSGTRLADTLFYSMEKAIRTYRQFAQQNLTRAGFDVTIDQWLILKTLGDNADISLAAVARSVFKDVASVTRIVQLLEKRGYIKRSDNPDDKRRSNVTLTASGKAVVKALQPVIAANRRTALKRVPVDAMEKSQRLFAMIVDNCDGARR